MLNSRVIATEYGPVRGWVRDGVASFKGVRYGADTSAYRFQPPRPPQPWSDVANAFEFGPTCPQDDPATSIDRATNPFLQMIGLTDNLPESEDCLFLNVWTPDGGAAVPAEGLPVLVWVHSGGYSDNSGSSPSIDGAHLAREHGLVVVTFNHRLNTLGYTHLTSDPDSPYRFAGNVGQLDIVAVLEWVQRNIAAFGGDPGNVTLAGQSGGAMKISLLLAMPAAQGLFQRAILHSGTAVRANTVAEAEEVRDRLTTALGIEPGPDAAARLAEVPLPQLMGAYKRVARGMTDFGPVVDGVTVPCQPFSREAVELSGDKPLIFSDLDTEASLFLFGVREQVEALGVAGVESRLATTVGEAAAAELLAAIRADHGELGAYELAVAIISAGVFTGATQVGADARARWAQAPSWRLRNVLRTPAADGALMSPHELDVALAFGNGSVAAGLNGGTPQAQAVSEAIGRIWASFARTGSPAGALPEWEPYTEDEAAPHRILVLDAEPGYTSAVEPHTLAAMAPLMAEPINWLGLLA